MKKLYTIRCWHSKIQGILYETYESQIHSPVFNVIPLFFDKVPCQVPSIGIVVGDIAEY